MAGAEAQYRGFSPHIVHAHLLPWVSAVPPLPTLAGQTSFRERKSYLA